MPAAELVNRLISIVLVLLVLSLIVQATQEIIKHVLKIKPRHLRNALEALFTKAGLKSCAVNEFLNGVAVNFGRSGVFNQQNPTAATVTRTEIELWLGSRPVGVSVSGLNQKKKAVEALLGEKVKGPAAPRFATLQATVRPFLAALPVDNAQFTYKNALKEPFNPANAMRTIEELSDINPPPAAIGDLPAAITAVLDEWRNITTDARNTHERVLDWFETAIAAFNERYEMEMRRWTFGISLLVAWLFDVSIFDISANAFSGSDPVLRLSLAASAKPLIERLPGILITTLLLSAGAPFWQDILQSLFGLKALLRRSEKSTTQGTTLGGIR